MHVCFVVVPRAGCPGACKPWAARKVLAQHTKSTQHGLAALSAFSPSSLPASVPGFAGLVTARQLQNKGYKVLVLEGHDRPGGRVYTKRLEVRWLCSPTTGPQRSIRTCNGLKLLSSQQQENKEGHSPCRPGHSCSVKGMGHLRLADLRDVLGHSMCGKFC